MPHRTSRAGSLRTGFLFSLLLTALVPIVLIGGISIYTIHLVLDRTVEAGIRDDVTQIGYAVESHLQNLDYVSRQFAFNGRMAINFSRYFRSESVMERYRYKRDILEITNLAMNTNPQCSIAFYYFVGENRPLFGNAVTNTPLQLAGRSALKEGSGYRVYAPAPAYGGVFATSVFSIVREIESYDEGDAAVYIESDPTYVSQLFPSTLLGFAVEYVLAGADGTVLYRSTDSPDVSSTERRETGIDRGFSTVRYSSADGWSLDVHVPNRALQRPMNVWLVRYVLIGTLSLSFGLLAALVVWRRFYRRIGTVSHEMLLAAAESFANPISFSGIVEIDEMLTHLESMRCRVLELVAEVEREEAARGAIELEKLRNQISPHFLHNTLNNIQWLARMAGQRDIDRIVTLLTRILHYNLGKEGPVVRLEEELSIARTYLDLQTMRYDFDYTIDCRLPAEHLGRMVPRFVLQPLVENAVYHGVAEDGGTVEISAEAAGDAVTITVADDGPGIDAEAIERLLDQPEDPPSRVNGLGVGLGFVAKTMESYYGRRRHVFVANREPRGARVTLVFPASVAETSRLTGA